ncbi:unnamed protein product, partial [Arabidopsis halleri]
GLWSGAGAVAYIFGDICLGPFCFQLSHKLSLLQLQFLRQRRVPKPHRHPPRRVQSLEIAYPDFDLFSLKISIFGDPERRKSYKIKGSEVRYTMKEAEKHDSKDLSYERKRWWQKSTILLL